MADFGLTTNSFQVSQEALDALFQALSKHVRRPHIHFVEATEMIEKLTISQYVGFTMAELAQIEEESKVQFFKEETPAIISNNEHQRKPTKGKSKKKVNLEKNGQPSELNAQDSMSNRKSENLMLYADNDIKNESDPSNSDSQEEAGTSKLIKAFQTQEARSIPPVAAREKSPTLRIFASSDQSKGKRSVLDRLEDSKIIVANEQDGHDKKKAKRDLIESMRVVPAKTAMADRMAKFMRKTEQVEDSSSHIMIFFPCYLCYVYCMKYLLLLFYFSGSRVYQRLCKDIARH